jgi:hypothetical protein
MTKSYKSPYASSFKTAIKNGTPAGIVVSNIASRSKTTPAHVFGSLHKAGLCHRQKFNGQWIYWPANWSKTANSSNRNNCQNNMWQSFVDWFIASGYCTPSRLNNSGSSQSEFMSFCRKFFNRQFSGTGATSRPKSRKARRSAKARASKRSASSRKRTSMKRRTKSASAKKRNSRTNAKKRSTTTKAKRRTTGRKPSRRTSAPRSFKFPTSIRSYGRKAA